MCECIAYFGVQKHSKDCKVGFPNKPHVHAELIKAWADGAEIERMNTLNRQWERVFTPGWSESTAYRIKPSPPAEPDYAETARTAWYGHSVKASVVCNEQWRDAAEAVIKAYQAHEKALKDFQD